MENVKHAVPKSSRFALKERKNRAGRLIEFPGVEGKLIKRVQVYMASESNSVTVEFQDKTALHFDIEPGLTLYADRYSIKSGNVRVLKEWPLLRSKGHRL